MTDLLRARLNEGISALMLKRRRKRQKKGFHTNKRKPRILHVAAVSILSWYTKPKYIPDFDLLNKSNMPHIIWIHK